MAFISSKDGLGAFGQFPYGLVSGDCSKSQYLVATTFRERV